MDLCISGRTAYITGGAQGIGGSIAETLAGEGVRVAVADIDTAALDALSANWSGGDEPVTITADLSTAAGLTAAVDQVLEVFGGPPDILVNNVGRAVSRAFEDIDDEAWQESFQLNFMSHVRTSRALVPLMAGRDDGRTRAVVNISSDLAKQPETVPVDYGSMKAAILYLTKALALQFAPSVRTNAVLPGPVWTGLWSRPGGVVDRLAEMYGCTRDEALERYLKDRQLTFGIAEPEHVATLVSYLVSPRAGHVNGSAFDVGGTVRGLF